MKLRNQDMFIFETVKVGLVYGVLPHIQQYFSLIVAVGFVGGGNWSTGYNHRPIASH